MTGYNVPREGRVTFTREPSRVWTNRGWLEVLSYAAFECGFAFLSHWARVRRIVAGRHGGPRVFYYTNTDAVEQDFGSVAGRGANVAYRQALAAFDTTQRASEITRLRPCQLEAQTALERGTYVHQALSGLLRDHPNMTAEAKLDPPWRDQSTDEILADLKLITDKAIAEMRAEDERSAAYWASIGAGRTTCETCGAEPGYPCPVPTGHPCGRDEQ